MDQGFTWLASYPKSGNTFLRLLLEAYKCNGLPDINHMTVSHGDAGLPLMQGVSPLPVNELGFRGEALLRPAALLHLYARLTNPVITKTHWANLSPKDLPPFIPKDFTRKAVYVVRDPRDIFSSLSDYFGFAHKATVEAMRSKEFILGGEQSGASRCMVSTWSNHVSSWVGEKDFPVHVVKYEDMVESPERELREVIEFMDIGWDIDESRLSVAADSVAISKMRRAEKESGFRENRGRGESFFNEGGSRWRHELGPKWIKQIEEDHGEVMRLLGYLDEKVKIKAVS